MKKYLLSLGLMLLTLSGLRADEGMWLPLLVERLNHADMQKAGLRLSAEEIYSVNQGSLKDAIVSLGGFCTAEVISAEGLMLTNHHCAYDAIQTHSSVESDYLTDGFWAMRRQDELPNEGLTARFLIRMEDVTEKFADQLNDQMSETERRAAIAALSKQIQEEAQAETHYDAAVRPMFEGNEFYLFVYETFRDVRLVGAPPSAIGKFGGDTDNWMWPRHTGDFALLRVYAGPDGKPADYSPQNVPLKPRHHLPVSLKGIQEGDFAMIMGYPGRTDRYLTSQGVRLAVEESNPSRVKLRAQKLDIMKAAMDSDPALRIQYASKYASVSNYWKYFIGQTQGLKRLRVYDKKAAQEAKFREWVRSGGEARQKQYGEALDQIERGYAALQPYNLSIQYLNEAAFGPEVMSLAYGMTQLLNALKETEDAQERAPYVEEARADARAHFKDYHAPTDQKIFAAMMAAYYRDIPAEQRPEVFKTVTSKHKGDFDRYAEHVFRKSVLTDSTRLMAFLDKPSAKVLEKDPAIEAVQSVLNNYFTKIVPPVREAQQLIERGNRHYVAGLRQMQPDRKFYPNANSTMRLTYGQVRDYFPRDAVAYDFQTTLAGVMEKEDPKDEEFVVPARLRELYEKQDFGMYAEDGQLPVGFITNTDITGGNSGSPVINADGHLIGCAFDGNWEAMSGDIAFEPELQRTISVDIRYILFIIDKYAQAGHLIEEMTVVKADDRAQEPRSKATGGTQ